MSIDNGQVHPPVPAPQRGEDNDGGADARVRLNDRRLAYLFRRMLFRTFLVVLAILTLALAGLFAYAKATMVEGTTTDNRECRWPVGKIEITGTRSYTYPYRDILGHRTIDKSRVYEKTTIVLPKELTTVVGVNRDGKWYGEQSGGSAVGQLILKRADYYTVVSGQNFGGFNYDDFCNSRVTPKGAVE